MALFPMIFPFYFEILPFRPVGLEGRRQFGIGYVERRDFSDASISLRPLSPEESRQFSDARALFRVLSPEESRQFGIIGVNKRNFSDTPVSRVFAEVSQERPFTDNTNVGRP